MRVVGGEWKGRYLEAPSGRDTRPTTDRVREAIASMLLSHSGLSLEGAHVLDAFAGSGALGIELLSRGAQTVSFFDKSNSACSLIKKNLKTLGVSPDRAKLSCSDVFKMPEKTAPGTVFTHVLLDPPYAFSAARIDEFISTLIEKGLLCQGGIVLYEHESSLDGLTSAQLELKKTKRYGTTSVDLYIVGSSSNE